MTDHLTDLIASIAIAAAAVFLLVEAAAIVVYGLIGRERGERDE